MRAAAAAVLIACAAVAGCGQSAVTPPPAAQAPPPPAQAGPAFSCAVMSFNELAGPVNAYIDAHGFDGDNNAKPPEFRIGVTTGGQVGIGSLTVAGFDATGTETGSTSVDISQLIAGGQELTFWSPLPDGWYQVTASDKWGNPVAYAPAATSCRVLAWSSS